MGSTVADSDPKGRATSDHRPVFVDIAGRGHRGKSTLAWYFWQRAQASGRVVRLADANRNATLASLCPGVSQPPSEDTGDVKDWLTNELGAMVTSGQSLMTDLGPGSDRLMQEYGHELNLVRYCAKHGWTPFRVFLCGPEMEDFEYVLHLVRAAHFVPSPSLLVFNAGVVRGRKSAAAAFSDIRAHPECQKDGLLARSGIRPMLMPGLPCMDEVRESGLTFIDAAAGKKGRNGKPLDPARCFMVEDWMGAMEAELSGVGVEEWVP